MAGDDAQDSKTQLQWTGQAAFYAVLGLVLVVAGAITGRMLVLILGGVLVSAVFLDSVAVWVSRPHLNMEVSPNQIPEGAKATVHLQGQNVGRRDEIRIPLAPALGLAGEHTNIVRAPHPRDVDHRLEVTASVRGPQRIGPAIVRHWSFLRLWALDRQQTSQASVEVIPRTEDASEISLLSRMLRPMQGRFTVNRPGQGMDFFTLREYQQGDTIRSINWKATARADDLIVNQRQRETHSEILLLLDARLISGVGPHGRTPLDRACRVVLGLYEEASAARDPVRFYAYGNGKTGLPEGRGSDRLFALKSLLARLGANGDQSVAQVWTGLRAQLPSDAVVILLTSAEGDTQLPAVVSEMAAYGHPVTIVSPTPTGSWWSDDPARRAARERILDELRNSGAMVVDWKESDKLAVERPMLAKEVTG